MTKKHYIAIAKILKEYNTLEYDEMTCEPFNTGQDIASDLADYFATDNKNFDRARFLEACGVES